MNCMKQRKFLNRNLTSSMLLKGGNQGNTGTPWLGPDVQDLTRDLYKEHQFKHFIYTPVGFVCEHLEVLYDNDYECKVVCDDIGVNYYRPEMPNTHPLFIGAIVDEIQSHI